MILLEIKGLGVLVLIILAIMFGPSIILWIIAAKHWRKDNKDKSKKFLIAGVVYALISLGVCGLLVN